MLLRDVAVHASVSSMLFSHNLHIWPHICVDRKRKADFYDHVSSIRAPLLDSHWEADLLEEWIICVSFWTWFLPHVDSHINVTLRLNCDNFSQLFLQSLKYNTVSIAHPHTDLIQWMITSLVWKQLKNTSLNKNVVNFPWYLSVISITHYPIQNKSPQHALLIGRLEKYSKYGGCPKST